MLEFFIILIKKVFQLKMKNSGETACLNCKIIQKDFDDYKGISRKTLLEAPRNERTIRNGI